MNLKNEKISSLGLLLLRAGIGGMMLVHGIAKVQGFEKMAESFPDPIGVGSQFSLILAIGAEVGCSILLIAGLFSRLAAIPLAFTMVVATFVIHASDPWKARELAALYLLVYISLTFTGPGVFSLDQFLFGRKSTDSEMDGNSR